VNYPNLIYTVMLKYKKKEVSFRIDVFELAGNSMFFVNSKYVDGDYMSYVEI